MKSIIASALIAIALFLGLWNSVAVGTITYKKQTGKKCTFCHSGIPEPGDPDPQLNEEGRKFKQNGYRLTDDQKDRP